MKVLIVAPLFPPLTGGSATYFKILTDFLKDQDEIDEVTVLTGGLKDAPELEEKGKLRISRTLPSLPKASSRMGWILGEGIRFPSGLRKTNKAIKMYEPDVVHVHKTRAYGGAVLAARRRGIPVIGDVRDLNTLDVYKKADVILVGGRVAMKKMVADGIPVERIEYIPIPFDLDIEIDEGAFDRHIKKKVDGRPYILYVGELNERKGVPELVEAHRGLRGKGRDVDLVLVGRNPSGLDIQEGPGLHVLDQLPHAEAMDLVRHAEVVILPSKWELFGRTCVEGVILGRKVIFPPNVPEFEETVKDFVLPEITPEAIQNMLEKVLDGDTRPDYPLGNHDAKVIGRKVLDLYLRLTAR